MSHLRRLSIPASEAELSKYKWVVCRPTARVGRVMYC
jgi:hypothetical protein